MSQPETTTDDETYTVEDLVINLALVQDFKLLHLQTASFNDRDVLIFPYILLKNIYSSILL